MDSPSRKIHFNALPESVRVRVAACLSSRGQPVPSFSQRTDLKRYWIICVIIGIMLLVGSIFPMRDEADRHDGTVAAILQLLTRRLPAVDEGPRDLTALAGLGMGALLAIAGVTGIMHLQRLGAALPFPPGRYLFPIDFVEARGPVLTLHSMLALTDMNATHMHTNGMYTGTNFVLRFKKRKVTFFISDRARAEETLASINAHRRALVIAAQAQDWQTLRALDPFFDARVSPEWAGLDPSAPVLSRDAEPKALALRWPLASAGQVRLFSVAAACVVAPAMLWIDNLVRDERAFGHAKSLNTPEAFRSYLDHGMRHVGEVRADLLPRAAFQEAERRESVRLFRAYLREFGGHALAPEAKRRIHDLYAQSLGRAIERADPSVHEFLGKLFAWLEQNDSQPFQVRFAAPTSEVLAEIDRRLAGKIQNLPLAPVAPSFTTVRCVSRESDIVAGLSMGFIKVVPGEILTLSRGAPLKPGETTFPQPTVAIHYTVNPSGSIYEDEKRTRAFVGITVNFSLDLTVPDAGQPMRIAFAVVPPTHFTVHERIRSGPGRPADETVYDTMAARAFDTLADKLGATFFKKRAR